MTDKKRNFQKEFSKILNQTGEKLKIFGKELGEIAKKGEEEIIKASKAGRVRLDILGLNVQKEKLYYDIGKRLVQLHAKRKLDIPELESYWKKLRKIEQDARKKKRELRLMTKARKG